MRKLSCSLALGLLLTAAGAAQTQTKLSFDAASIKPAAPLDMQKLQAAVMNGGAMPIGPHVGPGRAEYTYMSIKELILLAYKLKAYQVTGPDFLATQRFDIVAKYPEGATKADAPRMLQSLLEDRFKLTMHHDSKERPVLGLVLGKNASKLKDSGVTPPDIDPDAPLKPGEISMETSEGQMRMTVDLKTGSSTMNMGSRGSATTKPDIAAGIIHITFTNVTMSGFADTLSQMFTQFGGNGKQVVDMTGLTGHYEANLDLSLNDMIAAARAQGMDIPGGAATGAASNTPGANAASDPSTGGTSVTDAVSALGLKLEGRKAQVDQVIIDHVEKSPIEN